MDWRASASASGRWAPIETASPQAPASRDAPASACARTSACPLTVLSEVAMLSLRLEAPIRVLLADDHAVVREGYRRLLELEPDMLVVGECPDAESARSLLEDGTSADVLVLDLSMPGIGGLALLRHAAATWPALRVLVFTM